ncbi:unnamed protein product [Phytomonas sp. EM1]|nr:unnamed protein product [Phytomonas sp. EM1]|eukprot:CCW61692.1 unnamed protein product [Phytomonas sp. isolate EM1]
MIEISGLGHLHSLLRNNSKVCVIYFYATWCGPCKYVMPSYLKMVEYNDTAKVVFCKCDVDRNGDCTARFKVDAMPTFVVCVGEETIGIVKGGQLDAVQRNIDMALAQLVVHASEPMLRVGKCHNEFAEKMLCIQLAQSGDDAILQKDSCDEAYRMLMKNEPDSPSGLKLIPYLASTAASPEALDALFRYISLRAPPECYNVGLIVNQVLRYVLDLALNITWDATPIIEALHRVVHSLIKSVQARDIVVRSSFFDSEFIRTGFELEQSTILGALLGIGPVSRGHAIMFPQLNMQMWQHLIKLFPPQESEKYPQQIYEIQQIVERLAKWNSQLVQTFFRTKCTRNATMIFFNRALRLNEDYQKIMHRNSPLSSRFFMLQMEKALIEVALPIISSAEGESTTNFSSIPASYLLDNPNIREVISFGADTERLAHFDEHENPLPLASSDEGGYKPYVHLFFYAARSLTLCSAVFTDEHDRNERNVQHPQLSHQERIALTAEKCLYEGLLGGVKLGESQLRYLNGLAGWLLCVMGVDSVGHLPATPPMQWKYLPQQLVDCVFRASKMLMLNSLLVDNMISLMLVLMGNTLYFTKPHTHALFPSFLIKLMENPETRAVVEGHAWFHEHIMRACMNCYIAVEKLTYEKVQVRYELSYCLKTFLGSDNLCQPLRDEFQREGAVLERFSHMAVAEVNEAVDQLIHSLTKMNTMMKSSTDASEEAANAPHGSLGGSHNDASSPDYSSIQNTGDENDEAEDSTEEGMTYSQIGMSLRSHIMLFMASIDMFIQLSIQFPRGVTQNLVAQQIGQMLARSLVVFAGPNSKNLKIKNADEYQFKPREILSRLVDCLTHFRRSRNFLNCLCHCGIPLSDLQGAIKTILQRQLVSEDLNWKLSEMSAALESCSKEAVDEEALWDEAPDFALDALLSTPLLNPVALPSDVKDLQDLLFVNKETIHHHLLSENKHPFTKEYLDEPMVEAFNARPAVLEARKELENKISEWLRTARKARDSAP